MKKTTEAKLTGVELWEEIFGEEMELYELEDTEGVTDIEQKTKGVNGWWIEIEHTFRYMGKRYSLMEKTHSSPDILDNEYLWETFCEIEEANTEKTVILYTRGVGNLPFSKSQEPQSFYEEMVKKGETVTSIKGDESSLVVEILEYDGEVPPSFVSFISNTLLEGVSENKEIFIVRACS